MARLTKTETALLKRLNTPQKIQDFLDRLKINFEPDGETCCSPRTVLRRRTAHCIEAAMLAAAALKLAGRKPLLMDLRAVKSDQDHVVALFRQFGRWGAISKSNHGVLRFREPIYRTLRELALSYFHEYTDARGQKTLRSYSRPLDLDVFGNDWLTDPGNLWYVPNHLDDTRHFPLMTPAMVRNLRLADKMERKVGRLTQWQTRRRAK